ncbi:hypothetical protein ABEF95_016148 [Exophiala dermatitidis]
MSSAFFRRPTDISSSSSSSAANSTSEDDDENLDNASRQRLEEVVEEDGETATTESLISQNSVALEDGQNPTIGQHRANLLSALLEDFARTRACEIMNSTSPGVNFTRTSPEVQPLARKLYQDVSQTLALGGVLPASTVSDSQANQQTRATYLAGIERLAIGSAQSTNDLTDPRERQLALPDETAAMGGGRPAHRPAGQFPDPLQHQLAGLSLYQSQGGFPASQYTDLTFSTSPPRRSHYESSFQQLKLLGKGGFGRVYHAYNIFDKKEYAVKKIPLSPRLSQRYRDSGHKELENVLREVQALAQLEHSNVVRYHATWIEEPRGMTEVPYRSGPAAALNPQGQKLIAEGSRVTAKPRPKPMALEHDDGIIFGLSDSEAAHAIASRGQAEVAFGRTVSMDHGDGDGDPEGSRSSVRTSEVFTDGLSHPSGAQHGSESDVDNTVYVLHVQMSVYPTTLAQYLAPTPSGSRSIQGRNASTSFHRKHCFHLGPALRILMGILCGLQYIHAKGLVHRDIKPSNIFLSSLAVSSSAVNNMTGIIPDGYWDVGSCRSCPDPAPYLVNPRIGDFGLVADLAREGGGGSKNKDKDKPVGTQYYRPPPGDDRGKSSSEAEAAVIIVDEKLDVFALGVVLVEMLWPCSTSSERVQVLRDLQEAKVPAGLGRKLESEGHDPETARLVVQGILGMVERDPRRRWSCAEIKCWAEKLLQKT